MSLYGATEIALSRFGGGLVLDLDPEELSEDQASDLQNVDLESVSLAKRKGKAKLNSSAPTASRVRALHAYYPRDGSSRRILMQAGTVLYDEGGTGTFSSVVTGLTAGRPGDFLGWREEVFFGNGVDALRKRDGSGTWSTVANYAAPAAAPTLAAVTTTVEAFDSGTWTSTNAALTSSQSTETDRDGSSLKVTASSNNAKGAYLHKTFGATQDLSGLESLTLWVYATKPKQSFQVALYRDGETPGVTTPAWTLFPTFEVTQKDSWFPITIPLASIAPTEREAVPGIALRYVSNGGKDYNISLYFDDLKGQGPLVDDTYEYYYTYYNSSTGKESGPSAAGIIEINAAREGSTPISGVTVTVTGVAATGANAGIDYIRVYRYRRNGVFEEARLIEELANPGATTASFTDTYTDGEMARDDPEELLRYRADPPLAYTYALVNARLIAANVSLSGTRYPWQFWVSRFNFPEQFGDEQNPNDANAAGWFNIPGGDHILRVIDYDGTAVFFCDRSIWTLAGSGWDDFSLQKRADVGLAARNAVCVWGRYIFFLASDGLRVILPNGSYDGEFPTWVLSEPVQSRIEAIPAAYRGDCALGLDERNRLHLSLVRSGQTVPDAALVFDPERPGALGQDPNPARPGWTYYTNWGASCFLSLKRGGGDNGELLAGDPSEATVYRLHKSAAGADLEDDAGSAITWHWQSRLLDGGAGRRLGWVYVTGVYDAASGQSVTFTPVLDGAASATTYTQSLGSASSGLSVPDPVRTAASILARNVQVKVGGSHSVLMRIRKLVLGVHAR